MWRGGGFGNCLVVSMFFFGLNDLKEFLCIFFMFKRFFEGHSVFFLFFFRGFLGFFDGFQSTKRP